MRNPNASQARSKIASPFQRYTTPRIANRKVLAPQDANKPSMASAVDIESASAAPSTVAPSTAFTQFSFTVEDLNMTQFEKADSEFFAEFNTGNNVFSTNKNEAPASQTTRPEQVVKQPSKDENSLNPDDCHRSLDINDINDIVNASKHHHPDSTHRFHRDNDNPSVSLHSEVSSYMEECSTAVKSLNSSPHSVMEWDSSTFASSKMSKPRRTKKSMGNFNTSSFSEAGESRTTRDTFDDETSSFVSSKVSYSLDNKVRVRVGKISDDSSSKQSSVVENIVYSAPLARLHEFITGDGLCCTTKGQPIIPGDACSEYERSSPRKKKYIGDYDDDDFTCLDDEDDATYDDTTYDDRTEDTASYHRRGGSAVSYESSAYYTSDDDETISRASTRYSSHHVVKMSSPQMPSASLVGSRGTSRGRSPTIRSRYNSDRSLSRGASTASSFESDEKHVQGTSLGACESKDQTVESNESSQISAEASAAAESVLSQDQALWMEMTAPSPEPSPNKPANVSMDSTHTQISKSKNVSVSPTKSNFMQNLQSRTASARVAETKAEEPTAAKVECLPPQSSPETDGCFKKLLSMGMQLQINDPPGLNETHRRKRMGKLLLRFNGSTEGKFEAPFFIWKDMNNQPSTFSAPDETNKVESILLSDVKTIRKPREAELEGYSLVTPTHCFVLALLNGVTLFLEAVDALRMDRVTAGLNGVLNKLEQDINTRGDYTWIMKSLECVKKRAVDVQPHVVKNNAAVKKSLLQEAAARRKMKRR
jgi:hypothetical protein